MKHLDEGSLLIFGIFSLTVLNQKLHLTLIPEGVGGEIAVIFMVQTKKVAIIEKFKDFSINNRILSVILNEKNELARLNNFFDKILSKI